MADDNKPIIDLSQAQAAEGQAASGDDILSLEEELLGSGSSGSGSASSSTGGTTQTATTTKAEENKFHIPQAVRDENPELIPLILQTESMDDEERE